VKLLSFLAGAVLAVLALPFLGVAAWALLFGTPTVAVLAFTAAWILLPLFNRSKAVRVLKFGAAFVLLPAVLALAPLMLREVDTRVEQLARKNRYDTGAFTFEDRAGIYGLNIVMGLAAYPLYPEAASETMLLTMPAGPFARRVFRSEFGLGSKRLRDRVREMAAATAGRDTTLGPARVVWDASEYRLTEPEARYALALNQTELWVTRRGRLLDVKHEVQVKYPDSALVTLVARPRLRMEEGLFWVLQNCGWLHPFTAEWRFTVRADDPRLR
jgi:hypothetical protein